MSLLNRREPLIWKIFELRRTELGETYKYRNYVQGVFIENRLGLSNLPLQKVLQTVQSHT
jgi:hypothetical protein